MVEHFRSLDFTAKIHISSFSAMTFQPAGDFLLTAAKKYQLKDQALGALVCEKFRKFLSNHYPHQTEQWLPQKFSAGKLSVQTSNAASRSALFLETHHLLEKTTPSRFKNHPRNTDSQVNLEKIAFALYTKQV